MQVKFCNINPKSSEILVFTWNFDPILSFNWPTDVSGRQENVSFPVEPQCHDLVHSLQSCLHVTIIHCLHLHISLVHVFMFIFASHLIQTWRAACRPWSPRCPSPQSAGWSSWHNFQTSEDSFVLKLQMTAGIHSNAESSRNIRNFILHSFLRHYWKCSTTQVSPTPHSASLKWSRPEILPPTWSRSGRWELFCIWRRIFKGDKDKPDLEKAEQDAGNDEDECMH